MALPATKNSSRDRLTLARQALDAPIGNPVQDIRDSQAGPIVTESMKDMGIVPDEIASTGGYSTWTGEAGAGGGGTTYSSDAEVPAEDGSGGNTGEKDPYVGAPSDFDEAAEQFNWSLLDDALQGVDTTEEEAQMQAQQDRMMGQQLMNQRAAAGASGMGESGAMMAMEGGLRSDAARQLGLDVSQLRRHEKQQAIENAMKAQGIDIEKMKAADQARLNELIASFMMNEGELPPEGGEDGGWGGPLDGAILNPIAAADDALANENTPFGKGTGQSETATSGDPESYATQDTAGEGDTFIENYTDPDGTTWSIYVTGDGRRYRVKVEF